MDELGTDSTRLRGCRNFSSLGAGIGSLGAKPQLFDALLEAWTNESVNV